MTLLYDLHSHSLASDGTLSPSDLVKRAHGAGVDVLALTDHDETAGLAEAAMMAEALGINLVKGVEVSVTWEKATVHLVGLNIDPTYAPLSEGLAKLREFRNWRAEEMGRRLEKHGVRDAYQGALTYCKGNIISRTHFARYLVEQGFGKDMRKVFKHFLTTNKPGYVPGNWASLEEAVGWITESGGQAVVAHPARYSMSATKLRRLLSEFKECGGEAMEVVSGSHCRDDCKNMATHAQRIGLRASAGSDYHGPENPWVELGLLADLPAGCEPVWESETWPVLKTANKTGSSEMSEGSSL